MARILLIDDEAENFIASIEEVLDEHRVETATDARSGLERLGREKFDLVLLDIRMPPTLGRDRDREGIEALGRIVKQWPRMPVLMLSVFADVDLVVEAIQMGAFHYIPKPPDAHKLRMLVEKALRHSRLEEDNRHLKDGLP